MRIVTMGGGGLWQPYDPTRDAFILSLARRRRPRVAFVGTASGDSDGYTANFFRAMASHDCEPTDLPLFDRRHRDLRRAVLDLDVVYVGGGNTLSLLAVWRAHGLDEALREAWDAGVVLCGVSAGMNCWFEQSVTDSYGLDLAALDDGLGFLAGSCCPHYSGDERRRPFYRELVGSGALAGGIAADDGAALVYEGTHLAEVVRWTDEDATAYRVRRTPEGVEEIPLPSRLLG